MNAQALSLKMFDISNLVRLASKLHRFQPGVVVIRRRGPSASDRKIQIRCMWASKMVREICRREPDHFTSNNHVIQLYYKDELVTEAIRFAK